ncbi:MAG: glycosyltransferase [Lachnospiraceae bacterium]|nr:glycosyltransferase [Lachnospiraceae bacterium]
MAEAIDSILQQSYTNFELIIVDDGSTDQTSQIIEDYRKQDKRIQAIRNKSNLKLPGSLNRGFEESRGEYLTWTSDDNILFPNCLEVLLGSISDEVDFVYAGTVYVDETSPIKNIRREKMHKDIWRRNIIGACFLYKREIYDDIGGYDENLYLVEDYDYWIRIARKYRMKRIDEVLYQYRFHKDSLTESKRKDVYLTLSTYLETLLEDKTISRGDRDKIRCQLAGTYYEIGDRGKLLETMRYLAINNKTEFWHIKKSAWMYLFLPKRAVDFVVKVKRWFWR